MQVAETSARGDVALTAAGPPLDYSFKELRTCAEIETEEPRSGSKQADSPTAAGSASGGSAPLANSTGGPLGTGARSAGLVPKRRCVVHKLTTSVKLNNNMLETVTGLPAALETAMPNPLLNLQWLDLSFNQLVTVEPELLRFINLKALYLHGNSIKALSSVDRLRKLPKLISLTLNGNPIEAARIYRCYCVGAVPQLRSLDHSTITEDEQLSSATWYKGHMRRLKERREKLEELKALREMAE